MCVVVARGANAGRFTVVKAVRDPGRSRVTRFAGFAGFEVVAGFSRRRPAVVACGARTGYAIVVKRHLLPVCRRMATAAFIRRLNMSRRLSSSAAPVMATCARLHRFRMVEALDLPRHDLVAFLALLTAANVVCRLT